MFPWVLAAHVLGVVFWLGGLFTVYWLLRFHTHAPKEAHEKLVLMERSLALMMDLAATVALLCGFLMAFWYPIVGNLFATKGQGWLHVKVTAVVLAILPVHGIVRARIKKFGQGNLTDLAQWQWSLLLVGITVAIIAVTTKFVMFK